MASAGAFTRGNSSLLFYQLLLSDIGVLANILCLILKPKSADTNNVPIMLCIPTQRRSTVFWIEILKDDDDTQELMWIAKFVREKNP